MEVQGEWESLDSVVIKVSTPEGTMFVTVAEKNNAVHHVHVHIGKAGSSLSAWADALVRVITLALHSDISLERVIAEVSNITSDRPPRLSNVRSGPEGIAAALHKYQQDKSSKRRREIKDVDHGEITEG